MVCLVKIVDDDYTEFCCTSYMNTVKNQQLRTNSLPPGREGRPGVRANVSTLRAGRGSGPLFSPSGNQLLHLSPNHLSVIMSPWKQVCDDVVLLPHKHTLSVDIDFSLRLHNVRPFDRAPEEPGVKPGTMGSFSTPHCLACVLQPSKTRRNQGCCSQIKTHLL